MLIRLQKYLADHGVASRRKCEEFIQKGFVKVNGKVVTEMGIKIDPEVDVIETGSAIKLVKAQFVYYAFHKPTGYVCSVTGPEKPKIMELLTDIKERIFPIGRLDKLSAGLLLLTNDGSFAYKMSHPKFEKEKEYVVKVREKVTDIALQKIMQPIFIHGKKTEPAKAKIMAPHMFSIILKEGRNRQIRRLCEKQDLHIEKLKRIRIGRILLGDLDSGKYRKLTPQEIATAS